MPKTEWVYCPVCGNKTHDKVREDTLLINFPLFCPKCKRETLISVNHMCTLVAEEVSAKDRTVEL